MRARPSSVRGPVLLPPCRRQRPLRMAGARQGQPVRRVRAPHRGARLGFPRGLPLRSGPVRSRCIRSCAEIVVALLLPRSSSRKRGSRAATPASGAKPWAPAFAGATGRPPVSPTPPASSRCIGSLRQNTMPGWAAGLAMPMAMSAKPDGAAARRDRPGGFLFPGSARAVVCVSRGRKPGWKPMGPVGVKTGQGLTSLGMAGLAFCS